MPRTRAAKQRAAERIRHSVREDDEVEFHPKYDTSVSVPDSTSSAENEQEKSVEGNQTSNIRVDELEREMGRVRDKVDGIDTKLDMLIAAAAPTRASTPYRPTHDWAHSEGTGPLLPPPRRLRYEENQNGYVDHMLREERFKPGPAEGKVHLASDIFTESLLPKPYMYISREGQHTLKQKLESRATITPMEYIHAAIKLVNDHRAYQPEDRDHIMRHIQDVVHDAMERPWENVRRWSQYVWDAVEKGEFKWSDSQLIHNSRVCIAMTSGGRTLQAAQPESKQQRSEVICRAFNSRSGCRQRSHHDEGTTKHLHICAYCDSVGRHCPGHNVIGCNSKNSQPGHPRPPQQVGQPFGFNPPRPGPQEQQWRTHQYPPMYSQQYPAMSKNGQ